MFSDLYKRLIIVGKGGSGKDYLVRLLKNTGYRYCVSHTSRPRRTNEVDGIDYYFIEKNLATEMIQKDLFYEYVEFNGWFYGTSIEEFNSANLFIMTPSGISKLKKDDRKNSFIIFLDIDEGILRSRLMLRNDADKIDRRIEADKKDFYEFTDFDLKVVNPDFTLNEILIALASSYSGV
jgi:guanylate kinase